MLRPELPDRERRPDGVERIRTASDRGMGNLKSGSTLPPTADLLADLDAPATFEAPRLAHPRAVAPAYVVVTFSENGRRHRRQVYLSLHSALKAKERAEKNGRRFELALFELVPTPHKPLVVVGGEDR